MYLMWFFLMKWSFSDNFLLALSFSSSFYFLFFLSVYPLPQDLEQYASSYSGLMRIERLQFIADHCPQLRIEALKMALSFVQRTFNVDVYEEIHRKLTEATRWVPNTMNTLGWWCWGPVNDCVCVCGGGALLNWNVWLQGQAGLLYSLRHNHSFWCSVNKIYFNYVKRCQAI